MFARPNSTFVLLASEFNANRRASEKNSPPSRSSGRKDGRTAWANYELLNCLSQRRQEAAASKELVQSVGLALGPTSAPASAPSRRPSWPSVCALGRRHENISGEPRVVGRGGEHRRLIVAFAARVGRKGRSVRPLARPLMRQTRTQRRSQKRTRVCSGGRSINSIH